MTPAFITPKLIIKNISRRAVTVLDVLTLKPGETSNIYLNIENLKESMIVDALRAPDGDLYREVVLKETLEIVDISLVTWSNSSITPLSVPANNTPLPGYVLSFLDDETFSWIPAGSGGGGTVSTASPPLFISGSNIFATRASASADGYLHRDDYARFDGFSATSLPASASQDGYLKATDWQRFDFVYQKAGVPATASQDGYLTKEDYQLFLDKRNATTQRIWQYQDFPAPVTGPLTLTDFQNGSGVTFNAGYIVNSSAAACLTDNEEQPPTTTIAVPGRWLPGNRVIVNSHLGSSIILNQNPHSSLNVRIYFLINLPTNLNLPLGYTEAPQFIRQARADFLDQAYVNQEGNETVSGTKTFSDTLAVSGTFQVTSGSQRDGYSLISSGTGVGTWRSNPVVAATAPSSPYGGQTWIDTTSFIAYCYDQNRSKWLSVDRYRFASGRDALATNIYLRIVDNIASSSTGYRMQRDGTITGITVQSDSSATWTFEVRKNDSATVIASLTVTAAAGGTTNTLNVDVSSGDELQFFCNGTAIDKPVGIVEVAWRV